MRLKEFSKDKMIKILEKFLQTKQEQKLINRITKFLITTKSRENKVFKLK